MRSTKKLAFLDRFYKKFCCGAKNHPHGWKKQKQINSKAVRRRLKADMGEELTNPFGDNSKTFGG